MIEGCFPYSRLQENRTVSEARAIYEQRISDAREFFEKHHHSFERRCCPFCGDNRYSLDKAFIDLYEVAKCLRCASNFVNPVPPKEALEDYYQNSRSTQLANTKLRERHGSEYVRGQDARLDAVVAAIARIRSVRDDSISVLEIGCNSGGFLAKLGNALSQERLRQRVDLLGIDLDVRAIENPVASGLRLLTANAETFLRGQHGKFDIVVFFELIEHLTNPHQFLCNVREACKSPGNVIFTTPNANGLELVGLDYNSFRPLAHAIFPPMHLNAFSVENVAHFAMRCGFFVERIGTPGKLDIDVLTVGKDHLTDPALRAITQCPVEVKGLFQKVISDMKASSHMLVQLRANHSLSAVSGNLDMEYPAPPIQ